ncbi:type II toxin-antitoxin system VapB family antitoxin [Microbacterium sp.]|uniref:type II toxin-antitoxin system VapB family antitoxin n=1 Tax=Microbacterium sp. TaxID=51671 RepID=UPI003A8E54D5
MSLNIKNERTHALVRELAGLTGMSQTSAVESAVRLRLEQLRAEAEASRPATKFSAEETVARRAEIERIIADFHAHTTTEQREALRRADDEMYDEMGLPR